MSERKHQHDHPVEGCAACDLQGTPDRPMVRLATVKLSARGEEFRLVQLRCIPVREAKLIPAGFAVEGFYVETENA